jgi:hypothetical protein
VQIRGSWRRLLVLSEEVSLRIYIFWGRVGLETYEVVEEEAVIKREARVVERENLALVLRG